MEQIYTIPVNEEFERTAAAETAECPFCRLYNRLENQDLDTILGGAMMEPAIREMTNRAGFCDVHFKRLLGHGKRLPLALVLESHLQQVLDSAPAAGLLPGAAGTAAIKKLGDVADSCYLCGRIRSNFDRMVETAALLWEQDETFREKCRRQKGYCLPHYVAFLKAARERLGGKAFGQFYRDVSPTEQAMLAQLKEDVSWFCKKFDYRFGDEPWNGCKDAPERAVRFLAGNLHLTEKEMEAAPVASDD